MAYAFVNGDGTSFVAVPELAANNTFTGVNTFSSTTESTSTSTGAVLLVVD